MAPRPAPAKKAPAKKAAAKPPIAAARESKPAAPAPKAKAVAAPVVTLKAVFEQLAKTHALPKKQRPYVAPTTALDVRSCLGHVPYMFTGRGGSHGLSTSFCPPRLARSVRPR